MLSIWTDTAEHDLPVVHDSQKVLEVPHVSVVLEDITWTDAFVLEGGHMAVDQWQDLLCVCSRLRILGQHLLTDDVV